jgi:hypothetical protein
MNPAELINHARQVDPTGKSDIDMLVYFGLTKAGAEQFLKDDPDKANEIIGKVRDFRMCVSCLGVLTDIVHNGTWVNDEDLEALGLDKDNVTDEDLDRIKAYKERPTQ